MPRPVKSPLFAEQDALVGLRDAMKRYPTLSVNALARAIGMDSSSLRNWLRGDLPKARYIEVMHDFIEGRVIPRQLSTHEWKLEPKPAAQDDDHRTLMLAVGEVAAGSAALKVQGNTVVIERPQPPRSESEQSVLDSRKDESEDEDAMKNREGTKPVNYRFGPRTIKLLERLAETTGKSKTDVLRLAVEAMAKTIGVSVT